MDKALFTLILLFAGLQSYGQYHREVIKKELSYEKLNSSNVFLLANVNGSIDLEGYDGDKVLLEAELSIRAKTSDRLEKAKDKLDIKVLDRYDSILVYIQGPCGTENSGIRAYAGKKSKWGYNWNNCDYNFDFKINFTVKVPKSLNLYLSTINDGDIVVKGVNGTIDLHNINGSISVVGASKYTYAHSINGDITVDHNDVPAALSSYYTLNGDIKAYFPASLEADVTFKSFNGDIYTDYENIENKPMLLARNDQSRERGTSFKLEAKSVISFGGGGPQLDFETFNGDVYIRKK